MKKSHRSLCEIKSPSFSLKVFNCSKVRPEATRINSNKTFPFISTLKESTMRHTVEAKSQSDTSLTIIMIAASVKLQEREGLGNAGRAVDARKMKRGVGERNGKMKGSG